MRLGLFRKELLIIIINNNIEVQPSYRLQPWCFLGDRLVEVSHLLQWPTHGLRVQLFPSVCAPLTDKSFTEVWQEQRRSTSSDLSCWAKWGFTKNNHVLKPAHVVLGVTGCCCLWRRSCRRLDKNVPEQLADWFRGLRRARACARACVFVRGFRLCRENQMRGFFSRACMSTASSKCSPGPCN